MLLKQSVSHVYISQIGIQCTRFNLIQIVKMSSKGLSISDCKRSPKFWIKVNRFFRLIILIHLIFILPLPSVSSLHELLSNMRVSNIHLLSNSFPSVWELLNDIVFSTP